MEMDIDNQNEVLAEHGIGESAISNLGGGVSSEITDPELQDPTVNKVRRNLDSGGEIEAPNLSHY